jgi:hypothetical protein
MNFLKTKTFLSNSLSQKNFPLYLLLSYVTYCIINGSSYSDSIIIVILTTLFGFKLYLDSLIKPDINKEIIEEISIIKNQVSGLNLLKTQTKGESFNWFNK